MVQSQLNLFHLHKRYISTIKHRIFLPLNRFKIFKRYQTVARNVHSDRYGSMSQCTIFQLIIHEVNQRNRDSSIHPTILQLSSVPGYFSRISMRSLGAYRDPLCAPIRKRRSVRSTTSHEFPCDRSSNEHSFGSSRS